MEPLELVLLATLACEIITLFFLFCIARFFEIKFRESTYYLSFLIPLLVFAALLAMVILARIGLEWLSLITSACTLLVLMSAGLLLYKKMMGVAR